MPRASAAALFAVALATWHAPAPAAGPEPGGDLFAVNCLACHGADLAGVEGLGVSLLDSPFVGRRSAAELVEFLKVGRMPGDPESVSGRPMPGFGWLPDGELREIAAFVKARHGS
jgi:mono/diheme cytochrome c family protein